MNIHLLAYRVQLSGSQRRLVNALVKAGWVNDVYAHKDDAYSIYTDWNMPTQMWTLKIEREKRQPLVSVGTIEGFLLIDRKSEEEFAELLKNRLEELFAVREKLEAEAQARLDS
jgi:hypothetical protein